MLIDWFTVGAQALNFIVLVWLLKRFLYQPILDAVDAREKKIAAELADAEAKKAEAKRERDEFLRKNEEFGKECAARLVTAAEEAKEEGRRLREAARTAAELEATKRQEGLRSEAEGLKRIISQRTQSEVFAIAHKALAELATTSLEERMSDVFCRRLRLLEGKAKEDFGSALKAAGTPSVLRSAFDLSPARCTALQTALNETFSAEVRVRFETAPDLVAGIELVTDGYKLSWSIADYLVSMERGVGEILATGGANER